MEALREARGCGADLLSEIRLTCLRPDRLKQRFEKAENFNENKGGRLHLTEAEHGTKEE